MNNPSFYLSLSFNECVSETKGASNVQNFRLEVGIFAEVNSVFLAYIVTVIYYFLVEIVELVVSGNHSDAGFRSKDLFGLNLKGEGSWLPFVKETIVEESTCFSFEDQRV